MKTIYKYGIEKVGSPNAISMPEDAKIIRVGNDGNGIPSLWAEVDTSMPMETRLVGVCGTGDPRPEGNYIGSFEITHPEMGVWMIFHAYEPSDG
jgi:hypothetical protein